MPTDPFEARRTGAHRLRVRDRLHRRRRRRRHRRPRLVGGRAHGAGRDRDHGRGRRARRSPRTTSDDDEFVLPSQLPQTSKLRRLARLERWIVIAAADWTAWTCRVRVAVTDPAALDEARDLLDRPHGRRRPRRQPVPRRLRARRGRPGRRRVDADQPPVHRAARRGPARSPAHRRGRRPHRRRGPLRSRLRPRRRRRSRRTASSSPSRPPAGAAIELDEEGCRVRWPPASGSTSAPPRRRGRPTPRPAPSPRRPAAAAWSRSAATSPSPDRLPPAAGGSASRTSPVTRTPPRPAPPPSSPSGTAAWPPPRSARAAGSGTGSGCTT